MLTHRFDLSLFYKDELYKNYFEELDNFVPEDRTEDFNANYLVVFDETLQIDPNRDHGHGHIVKSDPEKNFDFRDTVWYDIKDCKAYKIKNALGEESICPWIVIHKSKVFKNDPGPKVITQPAKKVATEKKKSELNLDQSLNNYLIAEDLLKKMFLRNPQKTLRVLKKIYYPIMIDAKMQELADSEEELKTLKGAFGKLQSKKYRPDLRTEIFTKMRAVSDETGASFDKLKTLNATKGGLSKAAKGKFAENKNLQ
jgi:hypothetical protein